MMAMPRSMLIVLMLVGLVMANGQADAKVYKWVDENGVTRYSDTPPPGVAQESSPAPGSPPPESNPPVQKKRPPAGSGTNINFDLSGEVRNASGELINGVTMTITENHTSPDSIEAIRTRRKQTVNGRFKIVCAQCPIHRLRFQAPGYLSENYEIKPAKDEQRRIFEQYGATVHGVETPGAKDPVTIKRSGIVITLQPEDTVVRLTRTGGQLLTGVEGPLYVLAGPVSDLTSHSYQDAVQRQGPSAKSGAGYAVIVLSTGLMPFDIFSDAAKKNRLHLMDEPLYVALEKGVGGFIAVNPSGVVPRKHLDSLSEAPAAGYRKQLPVRPSDQKGVYFYCMLGDVYGKGVVYAPNYRAPGGNAVMEVQIEILLNPTGSRNLKSRFYGLGRRMLRAGSSRGP